MSRGCYEESRLVEFKLHRATTQSCTADFAPVCNSRWLLAGPCHWAKFGWNRLTIVYSVTLSYRRLGETHMPLWWINIYVYIYRQLCESMCMTPSTTQQYSTLLSVWHNHFTDDIVDHLQLILIWLKFIDSYRVTRNVC